MVKKKLKVNKKILLVGIILISLVLIVFKTTNNLNVSDKNDDIFVETNEEMKSRPVINIFLKKGTTNSQVQELIAQFESLEEVKEVKYISSEDALKVYQETNKDNPDLLELVSVDILPATLEVYINEIPTKEQQENLATMAEKNPHVDEVTKTYFGEDNK